MTSARPGVRSMNIAWRWPLAPDDLGVERHRQLGDRVEPRVRAVAREHLLDRDPRVAGPEQVDEAAGGDRLGAPLAGLSRWRRPGSPQGARAARMASSSQARPGAAVVVSSPAPRRRAAATGSQRAAPHRAIGGVDDRVDDEPVVGTSRAAVDAVTERLDDVAHHRVVAVGVRSRRGPGRPSRCRRRSSRRGSRPAAR